MQRTKEQGPPVALSAALTGSLPLSMLPYVAPQAQRCHSHASESFLRICLPCLARCWPVLAEGHDAQVLAPTGSGKTLGFLLPLAVRLQVCTRQCLQGLTHTTGSLQLLHPIMHPIRIVCAHLLQRDGLHSSDRPQGPLAVVLAPTREVAQQTAQAARRLKALFKLSTVTLFGGVPKEEQAQLLKSNPHILVASPGRLVDLMEDGSVSLGRHPTRPSHCFPSSLWPFPFPFPLRGRLCLVEDDKYLSAFVMVYTANDKRNNLATETGIDPYLCALGGPKGREIHTIPNSSHFSSLPPLSHAACFPPPPPPPPAPLPPVFIPPCRPQCVPACTMI